MSGFARKYSIKLPRDISEALRGRRGSSWLSVYVAKAVVRQVERDNLHDLISAAEAEHGPITEEEIQAKQELLFQARAEQTGSHAA